MDYERNLESIYFDCFSRSAHVIDPPADIVVPGASNAA
jgi:hypothetical protein